MNSLKSNGNTNVCRICLKDKAITNWNEEIVELSGVSYKDCYYKYTELLESASDPFPQNVCELCSKEFRNAYLLFEKAIHSLKILQASLPVKEFQPQPLSFFKDETELEISSFGDSKTSDTFEIQTSTDDEKLTDIVIETYPTYDYDNESIIAESVNSTEEITNEDETIELRHPDGITSELLADDLLKEKASESCDINSKKVKRIKKKYLCAYCSSTANSVKNLLIHEAIHSGNRERTHICNECGLKFYTKTTLNNHKQTHEQNRERKYKCEFCDKAFFNRGGCNIHRRIHLGQMFTCPICSKDFFRQIDLDRHLAKHSVAPLQRNNEKLKYTVYCQYCNESVSIRNWKEHKAVHLGQPQVKCKICEKDFFGRRRCVQHLKRLHRKARDDYELFIHYYVDCKKRTPHLMTKQQEIVQINK